MAQARSLSGGREMLAHHGGILRMQMHAHLAGGDRNAAMASRMMPMICVGSV